MDRGTYAALLVLVGLVLLANGAWAYPNEVSYETVGTYEAEPTDRLPAQSYSLVDYHDCRRHHTRACAHARHVAADGPVRVDAVHPNESLHGLDYVTLNDGGHYRTTERVENGTVVLDLERVDREQLQAALADDDGYRFIERAVENGSSAVREPSEEFYDRDYPSRTYLEQDGTVYRVELVETERRATGWGWREPPGWVVNLLRLSGWIGGVVLLVRAGQVSVE